MVRGKGFVFSENRPGQGVCIFRKWAGTRGFVLSENGSGQEGLYFQKMVWCKRFGVV